MSDLVVRGRKFIGIVTKAKAPKTVTVEWTRYIYVPKYERYEKRKSKVKAHDELGVKEGDIVLIGETRKISKTKAFVVIKKLGHKDQFTEEELNEMMEEQNKE
ncbi:MAG: 30S ribosomal protein S17 [Nanoarchaeota archaeon]